MSGSVPTTPVCYVDQLGIHAPSFQDVLTYLQNQYRSIYGQDVYLGNDSQDGQFLAVFALCLSDANSMAVSVYQSFSPNTAQGNGFSSVVKINGIRRLVATNSLVDLTIIGQAFTPIINGVVRDEAGINWLLPASVTIPTSGTLTVTAIAATEGAISAAAGTITTILTPTRGWQSVTNVAAALAGDPLESDAALRLRQTVSTALPSLTVLDGIIGSIAALPGVLRYAVYENDTGVPDVNGIPPHSIAFVVDGGDAISIATEIMLKKTPGSPTYGTTSQTVTDTNGLVHTINFFRPTLVPITVAITIVPLAGFTTATEAVIVQAIVDYINAQAIGTDILLTKLYGPANLTGAVSGTFNITSLTIAPAGSAPVAQDVIIGFAQAASCTINNVQLTAIVNP